jgi:hypothetical protein
MPSPPFEHGYPHDVFLSYTHTDDQLDAGRRWVSQFMLDLRARLEIVSGHAIDIWRDEEKLGAADRFNESIARAVRESAVLLAVLSPSYFNSEYCARERLEFRRHAESEGKSNVCDKSRIVKVAKFRVDLERYPPDLRELLEYGFYVQTPGSSACKEFHLSDDPLVRARYHTKVDDVAQEIALLLAGLEPNHQPTASRGAIYLAETTSDLEQQRDDLRRHLTQLGYRVLPEQELRLLAAKDLRPLVADALQRCRLAIHPIGAYYGIVPEGADGKSLVRIQLELSGGDRRNGDLSRLIWVPEHLEPAEDAQRAFLATIRTEYAGRGFELLERPYGMLATRLKDQLTASFDAGTAAGRGSGIYVVCDNADRAIAKTVRSFLSSRKHRVEWTPISVAGNLAGNAEHDKLLRRNQVHLVVHGVTNDGWIQDRIRELDDARAAGVASVQAIYLADPYRDDKDDVLVNEIGLLRGYAPTPVADALHPFVTALPAPPPPGGA